MTEKDIKEARELCEAATKELWKIDVLDDTMVVSETGSIADCWEHSDARFIVRARELMPKLADQCEQHECTIRQLEEYIDAMHDEFDKAKTRAEQANYSRHLLKTSAKAAERERDEWKTRAEEAEKLADQCECLKRGLGAGQLEIDRWKDRTEKAEKAADFWKKRCYEEQGKWQKAFNRAESADGELSRIKPAAINTAIDRNEWKARAEVAEARIKVMEYDSEQVRIQGNINWENHVAEIDKWRAHSETVESDRDEIENKRIELEKFANATIKCLQNELKQANGSRKLWRGRAKEAERKLEIIRQTINRKHYFKCELCMYNKPDSTCGVDTCHGWEFDCDRFKEAEHERDN